MNEHSSQYSSVFRPDLFKGEVHVVTGGGSGIGRCTAHELAHLGATVVITGRNQEKLSTVADEIEAVGGTVDTRSFDIRDEDAVKSSIASIVEQHGKITGLVNNAGGQYPAPLQMITKKGFEAVVATNLTGGFLVAREVYSQSMQRNKKGAIVNVVADMWNGMPGMGHSGAARAGMVNLTKTAAVEWASGGVRVNGVAPGWVASSGLDTYDEPMQKIIKKLKDHVPLRRMAEEAEISAAIAFLLSPASAFINGVTLAIDGGAPLGTALFETPAHKNSKPYRGFHLALHPKVLEDPGS